MKKYTKVLALALALTMLMGMSVFAADYTVPGKEGTGTSAVIDGDAFNLTTNAEDGEMYLLLVLAGDAVLPDKDNILYVNQETAEGDTVTFENVYPKSIANSTIYLAGGNLDGLTPIGTIEVAAPAFIKGDVDLNSAVEINDVVTLLRHVLDAKVITDASSLAAGEVTNDSTLDINDVVKLLRYVLDAIDSLD